MPIGENGKGFIGGQIQAITIARALNGSPEMILLDELPVRWIMERKLYL